MIELTVHHYHHKVPWKQSAAKYEVDVSELFSEPSPSTTDESPKEKPTDTPDLIVEPSKDGDSNPFDAVLDTLLFKTSREEWWYHGHGHHEITELIYAFLVAFATGTKCDRKEAHWQLDLAVKRIREEKSPDNPDPAAGMPICHMNLHFDDKGQWRFKGRDVTDVMVIIQEVLCCPSGQENLREMLDQFQSVYRPESDQPWTDHRGLGRQS